MCLNEENRENLVGRLLQILFKFQPIDTISETYVSFHEFKRKKIDVVNHFGQQTYYPWSTFLSKNSSDQVFFVNVFYGFRVQVLQLFKSENEFFLDE